MRYWPRSSPWSQRVTAPGSIAMTGAPDRGTTLRRPASCHRAGTPVAAYRLRSRSRILARCRTVPGGRVLASRTGNQRWRRTHPRPVPPCGSPRWAVRPGRRSRRGDCVTGPRHCPFGRVYEGLADGQPTQLGGGAQADPSLWLLVNQRALACPRGVLRTAAKRNSAVDALVAV